MPLWASHVTMLLWCGYAIVKWLRHWEPVMLVISTVSHFCHREQVLPLWIGYFTVSQLCPQSQLCHWASYATASRFCHWAGYTSGFVEGTLPCVTVHSYECLVRMEGATGLPLLASSPCMRSSPESCPAVGSLHKLEGSCERRAEHIVCACLCVHVWVCLLGDRNLS